MCVQGTVGTIKAGQDDREHDYKKQSSKLNYIAGEIPI